MSWTDRAKCLGTDPDMWTAGCTPNPKATFLRQRSLAKNYCWKDCPVRKECEALGRNSDHYAVAPDHVIRTTGIFGGFMFLMTAEPVNLLELDRTLEREAVELDKTA